MSDQINEETTPLRISRRNVKATGEPRRAWHPGEVADLLGVSYDSVLSLIRSGALRTVPAGRYHLVPDCALAAYLGENVTDAPLSVEDGAA